MSPPHVFRLIVFDYDGTLVDSQHVIVAAMAEAFAEHGLPAAAPEAVRRTVGMKLEAAVARLLPKAADEALAGPVAAAYRKVFFQLRERPDYDEPLFPGVAEGLCRLGAPNVSLGIATGKSRRGLLAGLKRHGIDRQFATLQTADDAPAKPHPESLLRAMADVGARPAETVVVGDTTFDMEMAGNARVTAIGVAWGYHSPAELRASGAARIVERFADLPAALAGVSETQACG